MTTKKIANCIFENEDIQVLHRTGSTPYTLATFSIIGFKVTGRTFWQQDLCDFLDVEAIGFVCKNNNWFPVRSMVPAIAAALAVTSKPVITWGHSQGGYGALKYSAPLHAIFAIASSPQYSIDPSTLPIVPHFEQFFRPDLHQGMEIRREDLSCRIFVIHDPLERRDEKHVSRILQVGSDLTTLLPLHHIGHNAMDVLADPRVILRLIAAGRGEQDLSLARSKMRTLKKRSIRYSINLARRLLQRGRSAAALTVLEKVLALGGGVVPEKEMMARNALIDRILRVANPAPRRQPLPDLIPRLMQERAPLERAHF